MNINTPFFFHLLRFDLKAYTNNKGEWVSGLIFFIMSLILFPLAIGPEPNRLNWVAGAIIFVLAVLSNMLTLEQGIRQDFENGVFEQLMLSPSSLTFALLAKAIAHWLAYGLPILFICPIIAILFNLDLFTTKCILISLGIAGPSFSLLGILGVTLTLCLKQGGVLLMVLILPMYMPLITIGASAIYQASFGYGYYSQLLILSAVLILTMSFVPIVMAYIIRLDLTE